MSRIYIVSIPVVDQRRAMEFYSDVLGFNVIRNNPMGNNQQWIQLAPSEGTATVTLVTWFDRMPA